MLMIRHLKFGVTSGLGMLPVTFDWAQVAYIGSPLIVPFWAAMNVVAGLIFVMWFIAPILCTKHRILHTLLNLLIKSFRLHECFVLRKHAHAVGSSFRQHR